MKIHLWILTDNGSFGSLPAVDFAFAAGDEPGEYLDRRVVIWNLFYKMMTVAFIVVQLFLVLLFGKFGDLENLIQKQNQLAMRELTGRYGWTL